jgi:hypothetical protein
MRRCGAVSQSRHANAAAGLLGKVVEGDGGEGGQLVALVSRATGEGRVYSKEVRVWRSQSVTPCQCCCGPLSLLLGLEKKLATKTTEQSYVA